MRYEKKAALISAGCIIVGVIGFALLFYFALNVVGMVGFSKDVSSGNTTKNVWSFYIKNYKSDYKDYNTYTHYSRLNKSEKFVYRALEYALDNSYSYILIHDDYIDDLDYTLEDILYLFSLDSPMVEQNLIKVTDSFTTTFIPPFNLFMEAKEGSVIYVDNFTEEKLEKKKEALSVAEKFVKSIPKGLEPDRKVNYIYENLGEKIDYDTYKEGEEKNYLFDALCNGESNCDGFTNAFSLVCNMAEIPCIEKMYIPKKGVGHTWNAFKIDGKWYNADLTAYEVEKKKRCPVHLSLGFEDALQGYEHFYSDIVPECNENLMEINLYIEGGTFNEISTEIDKAMDKSKDKYIVILWGENMTASENFMNRIANKIDKNFYYYGISGTDKKLYCLFRWY